MTQKDSLTFRLGLFSTVIITILCGLLIASFFLIINNYNKPIPKPVSKVIPVPKNIDFFTGNKDGFYYSFGAFNAIGSNIKNHETSGSYNSINEVINNVNSFGIAQYDVINNLPPEKKEQLRIIPEGAPLFLEKVFFMYSSAKYPFPPDLRLTKYGFLYKPEKLEKLARFDIASHFTEGRKLIINIGENSGGSQLLSGKLIKFITKHTKIASNKIEIRNLPMDKALSQFEKNNIDMWIFVTAKPQEHMREMLQKDYIHLVDFSKFDINDIEKSGDYQKTRIDNIVSLGVNATLVTSKNTNDNNIEQFLKVLRLNIRRLSAFANTDFPTINQLL